MFGDVALPPAPGTNTGGAPTATTLTDTGASFGTNTFKFHKVVAGSTAANLVWGIIQSHTGTVLTVDRWYNNATPGGAAGATPAAAAPYFIDAVAGPVIFCGLTTTVSFTPASGDTALSAEIATAGGGLVRKICSVAHTAGTSSATLQAIFTANGTDSLPAVVTGCSFTGSIVAGKGPMLYEDAFSPSATLSASGDQLTVSDAITL